MENNVLKNCKVMLFRSQAYRTLLHTGYSRSFDELQSFYNFMKDVSLNNLTWNYWEKRPFLLRLRHKLSLWLYICTNSDMNGVSILPSLSGWRLVFTDNHSAATWKDQRCVVQVTGNVSEHHSEAVTSCVMGMQTQTDGGTSLRY